MSLTEIEDAGNIGGSLSDEFHMLCEETGEDLLLHCNNCSYAANSELAVGESTTPGVGAEVAKQALESIRRCPVTASADSQLPVSKACTCLDLIMERPYRGLISL